MQERFLFLLIFAIILCVYPSYTTAEIRNFTHFEENNDYDPSIFPRLQRLKVYDDGTAVARIVRLNKGITNAARVCFYDTFSLRIIHLDGTVDEKDIKLNIPQINYCFVIQNGLAVRFLDYELIRKNQILLTYVEAADPNDPSTFEDWGMVIDFDGKEYSRIFFGPRYINITSNQFQPNSDPSITLNVNREDGFLRIYNIRGKPHQEWQQYKIEIDGTFTELTGGDINTYFDTLVGTLISSQYMPIATVDGGYAIILGNTINNFTATNPLLPQAQVSISPIGYNQTATSALTLYQSSLPNLIFNALDCSVAFIGVGQTCVLTVTQIDPAGAPNKNFFVKIDFLSSGSATNITVINNLAPTTDLFKEWAVESLHFGGFLLTNTVGTPTQERPFKDIYGYLFSGNDENYFRWDLPEPVPANTEGFFVVLPHNNTLLIPQFEVDNSWRILTVDLYKFAGDRDNGYNNLNVKGTAPVIDTPIDPKTTEIPISIDFYNPVDLSNGRLSIYQVVDKQQFLPNPSNQSNPIYQVVGDQVFILRQSVPGEKCSIKNDGKTVSVSILESTFSASEGNYFIKVDNEFVRDLEFDEPLLGIGENVWKFTTNKKEDTFAPFTTGLLRLNSTGTKVFDNLTLEEQTIFYDTLKEELSFAVPVVSRLTINTRVQADKGLKDVRYLISVGIEQTGNPYENSVASIIALIDTMIINKDQSPIGLGHVTSYLDETYGFIQSPNLWEAYKNRLIGLFVVIGIFAALFIFAQVRSSREKKKAEEEGTKFMDSRNLAIFQLGLIIFDLIIDILFVSTNAQDVSVLYIPSVVFITLPIAINTILAFYIISQENTEPRFYKWFSINGGIASIFIVLAGADIEALDILQSNLAGIEYFQAPFSKPARSKIFWGAFLNIFTEDIPQVIIQIYYRTHSVTYDIVPLLTLISSSVNLIINIIGRLYQATNRLRNLNIKSYNTPGNDTDDFGGLSTTIDDKVEKGEQKVDSNKNQSETKDEGKV